MPKQSEIEQPAQTEPEGNVARYIVEKMRLLIPKGKVADKNPERFLTVLGVFYAKNDDGSRGEKLTFGSKAITKEMALSPLTVIDTDNGTLVLPAGERGRKAAAGIEQSTVNAMLEALRNGPAEQDAEQVADAAIATVGDAPADGEVATV